MQISSDGDVYKRRKRGIIMADIKTLLGDAYQEDMTIDQINEALAAKEFVDQGVLKDYVPKATFDKTASEAADFKKKWKATQTEAEQKAQEEKDKQEAIEAELKALRRTTSITGIEKQYLGLGYDAESAAKISEATFDNDLETVFEIQQRFLNNQKKSIRDEIMKNTPGAASGNHQDIDYTKLIQEAMAAGDQLTVSALLRQQAASTKK